MAKKKDNETEVIDKGDWKLADGSDGPFKASYSRIAFNPYHFGKSGDIDYAIELMFDDGTEGKKSMPFYMDWWKHKPPPTVSDIIDFLVTGIISIGTSEEAATLAGATNTGWERWFYVRHCIRLTGEFKTLIGDDMFSAIAPSPVPALVKEPANVAAIK